MFKGFKRKVYDKLDAPYNKCINNKIDPNAYDTELFKKTIQIAGIYSKSYCYRLCVT